MLYVALGGLLVGLGVVVGVAFQAIRGYTHPRRTKPLQTPADYGLPYESARLRCDDGVLAAAWYIPTRNGAAIVLLHGLGANRESWLERASVLAQHGFGSLLVDLRAHGDTEGGECSIGYREVAEVRAAVEYLRNHPTHPARKIGVLGESLGGSVALLGAAAIPEIDAVAVDSTFCALDELMAERLEDFLHVPRWLLPLARWLAELQAGVRGNQVRPIDAAARLGPRPLLIIHGGQDAMFPPSNAERLYAAASGPKELWLVPEAEHATISCTRGEEYQERLLKFFGQALGTA